MKLSLLSLAFLASASAFNPATSTSPGVTSKTAGWEMEKVSPNVRIEGKTRHAFTFMDASKDVAQVAMMSPNDRPITAEINLWDGPDYTPFSARCHSENGKEYPIQVLVGTKSKAVSVEVKNIGSYTYPINAACSYAIDPLAMAPVDMTAEVGTYVEGGAVKMMPFTADIEQLQVLLKTDGKQLKAKIELLNGPNNVKQEFEVYASNGDACSLFVCFQTPGQGNSIRIRNLSTLEYPLDFYVRASELGRIEDSQPKWT